jgi:uncharacterized membrane protein YvbJ
MNVRRQVRCKSCGHWNSSEQSEIQCSQCGVELFPQSKADQESLQRRQQAWKIITPVDPGKPWPIRWIKHTINVVQLVFLAIISFIMWLIAMSPG